MDKKELLKEIKGVFKLPVKKYYFGKIKHGTPYFNPRNFNSSIISTRKLKLREEGHLKEHCERYPHLKNSNKTKFSNLPMVRRSKDWIIKLFNNYYWVQIGYPISINNIQLGWKWKYDSIRFEWIPSFQIYFFNWQFCIFWNSPDGNNNKYYEMILHYLNKSDRNLLKAEETWGWIDMETKKSTWDKKYLI